ncbi:DUF4265 domain-containing protein [Paenibacillus sp. UMB4589-SE434]|uniref:DUF4265 domain-containing protein n=1 Tax=Paenibacillus sp. UMB4589-SE434 TaxID=3046314 RepID=UPI002549D258|nr:DUF4265 domain-containing protein [Paenibacillus sp. UMB4589-SE434]MDK8180097.1 DUF4265 domain-containing protein [Paenibacillus sp. UMB4589-SE434]
MNDKLTLIQVFAGTYSEGTVLEELPAEYLSDQKFKLCASPGLALGLAKGDTIKLHPNGDFELIEHGGNFCVQIYKEQPIKEILEAAEIIVKQELAGSLDGFHNGSLAFTAPISNGFHATNHVFNKIRDLLESEYYYSNIYKNPYHLEDEELVSWARDLD